MPLLLFGSGVLLDHFFGLLAFVRLRIYVLIPSSEQRHGIPTISQCADLRYNALGARTSAIKYSST